MVEAGRTVEMSVLISQLKRPTCRLDLPQAPAVREGSATIAARCRASVVVVARLFRQGASNKWSAAPASGFFISESGAFITSYHVVDCADYRTIVVMTGDGRMLPVKEVLAADKRCDVAILRVEGGKLPALPLECAAPVGSRISVMSHTVGRYYTFTEGVISRRSLLHEGPVPLEIMEITADFGPGSSGGPVVNERGNVVGWVDSLLWLPSTAVSGGEASPPLMFRHCGVASNALRLVEHKQ